MSSSAPPTGRPIPARIDGPAPAGTRSRRDGIAIGLRQAVAVSIASVFFGLSFGVVAVTAGLSPLQATIMSVVTCAGAAQMTAVSILGNAGGAPAAILGAALMNSRFIPISLSVTPSLSGGRARRMVQAQGISDAAWAMSHLGRGRYDRHLMYGATLGQYVTLVAGTAAGAWGGAMLDDPGRFGLDAIVPAFFVGLIGSEIRSLGGVRLRLLVAVLGAALALVLVPLMPPGVPVLLASAAALLGLTVPLPPEPGESGP